MVNPLIGELVGYLKADSAENPIIRGAMAHLNLTLIHPFKDGNGRMARALQTLVIAHGGTIDPVFSSIEEWLGRNPEEYYNILALVGGGSWSPHRSAHPWIRFCLKAHYQQAATLIRRNEEYERLFDKIIKISKGHNLIDRVQMSLFDAALGFRVTNARYRTDSQVSEIVASRDLKKLCDIGLLEPIGEKRGRFYRAGKILQAARVDTRMPQPLKDPFDLVGSRKKRSEVEADDEPSHPPQ